MPIPDGNSGFDFSDAPGGDTTLDDIFGDSSNSGEPTTTEPQTPTGDPEPFLKTATGSVYKSADDAIAGIEHKDALINQLRQQLSQQTGVDPLKPAKTEDTQYVSYEEHPEKYFEDIKKAKTERELLDVQGRYLNEKLAPYAPLAASWAKSRAVEETSADIPEITTFLRSDGYKEVLEAFPLLKTSINIAENNPQAATDLSQLYRMAYSSYAGKNVSKIVQNTARTVAETRPTVSSTPTIAPGTSAVAPPSLATPAGRKSIIESQEARGVQDLRF